MSVPTLKEVLDFADQLPWHACGNLEMTGCAEWLDPSEANGTGGSRWRVKHAKTFVEYVRALMEEAVVDELNSLVVEDIVRGR